MSPSKPEHNPSSYSNSSANHSPSKTSAFSVLMSSHQENEAWKEATVAEDRNFRPTKGNGGRRKAPFYKVMTGMPIAVDAFRYGAIPGVTAYFLTHAHSDHYTNLSSKWKAGPIYCSEGTANLIIHMLSVDRKWVHPLPMDVPTTIPNTGGVKVTLIEANHCPGSSLFLFEGPQTIDAGDSSYKSPFVGSARMFRYLHCGDFRASPQHVLHPSVKGKRLDCIYLDTTYLNPKYTFPSQAQVISACADLAKKVVSGESVATAIKGNGSTKTMDDWFTIVPKSEDKGNVKIQRTLVVVGTYSIGKERVVKAVAKALRTKVYCDSRKAAILRCQADPELHAMLTKDPYEAGVHLVPLGVISSDRIKEYTERWKGHWSKTLAFRPTGWTYTPAAGTDTAPSVASIVSHLPHKEFTCTNLRPMRNSTATHQLFGVPYSEHSSFFELTCFALSLDWARIVATVNVGSESSRGKIATWVARWEAEKKKRGPGVVPYRTLDYW
ncbi:DRMBL-domain-containing protein [Dentipellis sp. KUC8613]|nr:DRMBL-domain-containing protein [Dentipellis sp. KUC8613]